MIQQFTFDGLGRQIDAKGFFFRYEAGTDAGGVVDIRLVVDGQPVGTFSPGESLELSETGRRWEIVPVSTGCVGLVQIGQARVTSPNPASAVTGRAFCRGWTLAPTPAKTHNIQLINLTSGATSKNVIVKSLRVLVPGTPAETLLSIRTGQGQFYLGQGDWGFPKRAGAPNSTVARVNWLLSDTPITMSNQREVRAVPVAGRTQAEVILTDPIVLPPQWAIGVIMTELGTGLSADFEWTEEAL